MDTSTLTINFYDAVWDLAERIALLPSEQVTPTMNPPLTPRVVLDAFKDAAMPFLDLEGHEIPRHLHHEFDQIDTTFREEIFPAIDVLQEEWDSSAPPNDIKIGDRLRFAAMCAHTVETLEMDVIPLASVMERSLK